MVNFHPLFYFKLLFRQVFYAKKGEFFIFVSEIFFCTYQFGNEDYIC